MSNSNSSDAPPPPPPPAAEDPQSKISPFVVKLRSAAPDWYYQAPQVDTLSIRTGPYFFYGTLTDPFMIAEILNLDHDHQPSLRPAYTLDYECKLWGQYPALLDAPGIIVEGAAYNVKMVEDAEKLAAYETGSYRAEPCLIHYADGEEPAVDLGSVFKFVGDLRELSEGSSDLKVWLKRMGRMKVLERLERLEKKIDNVPASEKTSGG